jgi:prepilin-type N-terminal cleavage/methylation domain-containing protein
VSLSRVPASVISVFKNLSIFQEHVMKQQKGFSLIEMAVVIAIIAVIVAALGVAKDTTRNAEFHKAFNKLVVPMHQAVFDYHNRTGAVLDCSMSAAAAPSPLPGIPLPGGSATQCDEELEKIGTDLPHQYQLTDEDGEMHLLKLVKVNDARDLPQFDADGASRRGGVVVTYTAPYQFAKVVDRLIDANTVDSDGVDSTGDTAGDVRIQAGAATGETSVRFSVRLRDMHGSGAVATPAP